MLSSRRGEQYAAVPQYTEGAPMGFQLPRGRFLLRSVVVTVDSFRRCDDPVAEFQCMRTASEVCLSPNT